MKYRFSNSKIHLFVLKSHLFWNKRLENLNNLLQTIYYPKWISVNCRKSKNWREESIFYWIFCLAQIYLYFCFKTAVDQWSIVLFLIRGSFTETWDPRVISLDFVLLKWGGNLGNYLSSKKKKMTRYRKTACLPKPQLHPPGEQTPLRESQLPAF